jgi:putative ABC transport system permease protein
MPVLSTIRGSFRALFRREELERDLDEEMQSILEMLTEEKIRAGRSPEQARREAWIELEGVEQVKARVREERHGAGLDSLRHDVRYTLRTLRRSPGFTLIAVLTLAIGIGATTALFSTLNAVLLRDLPYAEPDRLVAGVKTREGRIAGPVSRVDYFDFREHGHSFSDLAIVATGAPRVTVTGGGKPQLVTAGLASWNLFQTLGVQPYLGRSFTLQDEVEGAAVVVISHGFWQRRFGGDPSVVGSVLNVYGMPVTIVGVLPQGFRFLYATDLWALINREGPYDLTRDSHSHYLVGRIGPGVSFEQAQSELSAIADLLGQQYPDTNRGKGVMLIDLHRFMVWQARPSLLLLMATAGLVLLIACGNVAGLLLARGQRRLSEMAMRTALGAPRRRLIRQLLTESIVLTLMAGGAGILLAYLMLGLLLRLLPLGDPGVPVPAIDGGALLFALVVSIVTGLLVGIMPALRGTAINLAQRLRTGTHASEGVRGTRLRSAMVIGQVSLSILLLIGAGLLIRSLLNLTSLELGFEPGHLLTAGIQIQPADHPTPGQRNLFFSSLLEEIEALPEVVSAAMVSKLPIRSTATDWPIWPADQPRPSGQDARLALARWATPGYLSTMEMPILRGRDISDSDLPGTVPVVVVSEAVAQGMFPDQDAIGQHVGLGWSDETFEIIGVVGNARINGLRNQYDWAMYMSAAQTDGSGMGMGIVVTTMSLVVQSNRDPSRLVEPVRRILQDKDSNAMLIEPATMTAVIHDNLAEFRIVMVSLGLLAILALMLTAIGLYGVLAFNVSQRSNELGIRVAVGASSASLIGLVLKRGLVLIAVGLVLGLVGALPATRMLQQLLFGIEPLDGSTYLGAAIFLALVGLLACLLPAWRATRVNLVEVLRRD